jgi:2-keto-4-pentenoate hydratase/2-oxohepta-3-ene-1,7-dioic acid hydratase in catechol pathway
MPRYVSTSEGVGRLEADQTVSLLDFDGDSLDAVLRAGATPESLQTAARREVRPLDDVTLTAPVHRPLHLWAVGYAYADHSKEVGRDEPDDHPIVFLKASSSISGPYDDVLLPAIAPRHVDYEGEIAVVIGRRAASASEASAWDHVLGFMAANDVSARDVQRGAYNAGKADPSKAKSFATFTPVGPCVCTLDEYRDPSDIELTTTVDGERRQRARSSALVNGVPAVVAFISRFTTLEPGDVILTGTPAGVGHPQGRFLGPGNVVRVEVEGVGAIENRVVDPDAA